MTKEQQLKKKNQLKKQHHYVWADYLRNWATGDIKQKVWFNTARGCFAYDSVRMGAKEKHFYQIKPLSKEHVQVITMLSSKSQLHKLNMDMLRKLLLVQKIDMVYQTAGQKSLEAERDIEAHKHNYLCNGQLKLERT